MTGISVGALLPWLRPHNEAWLSAWIGALITAVFLLTNTVSYDDAKLILGALCGAVAGFVVAKLNARLSG